MQTNWQIGSLFGIPLFLDPLWFVILGLTTLNFGFAYQQWGTVAGWSAGLIMALLLFASVLLHELGHSLVAQSQGIKVNSITLFLFGGVAAIEEESNRVGISAPFDCKFVVMRCLFEFSLISEALDQLGKLKKQAQKSNLDSIYLLCEVGEIRVLSRNAANLPSLNTKFEALQDYLVKNQNVKSMSWIVDVAEIFIKNANNEVTRVKSLVDRNRNIPYVKLLDRQKYKIKDSELIDLGYFKKLPEVTAFQIIYKNLNLSKFSSEGNKRQREYLKTALAKGEEVGAREMFLRQDNKTLELIINFASTSNSQWLESLSRACMERIKERNTLLEFSGEQLTQREIEVLKYLTSGKSIEEIGKSLHISKNTMKTHLKNVYRKLKVNDRNEACKIAKTKLLV